MSIDIYPSPFSAVVSSAAGVNHEVAAAGTPAAGPWGWELRLVRGSLLWAHQDGKAAGAGSARNAAGSRKAPEAAAATESSTAAGPRESLLHHAAADHTDVRPQTSFSFPFLLALWLVDGEFLPGEPVERRGWHVGRAGRHGCEGSQRRLLQQHGYVGRGCEEPGQPPWQHQQQHGLEEQP